MRLSNLATIVLASLLPTLAACSAAPDASTESGASSESMTKGPGPGNPGGGPVPVYSVSCGGVRHLGNGIANANEIAFENLLNQLGCGSIPDGDSGFWPGLTQAEYGSGGSSQNIVYCPTSQIGWVNAIVSQYSTVVPVYSVVLGRGNKTACSNGKVAIPAGYEEIGYDPDCTGSSCGSIERTGSRY